MKVHARFLTSAASPTQFLASSAPEIAFLGRSNVGKSSLLNSLAGTKLARVSNTPGRTQTINFFAVDIGKPKLQPEMIFSDLPGYGYARVPLAIVGEWPKFIEPYLADRESLRLCICLVDSNIRPQKSDAQLIEWLEKKGRSFIVVATKADRISGNELAKSLKALTNEFGVKPLPYSSKTGKGRDDLWRIIRHAAALEEQ
jgi:GTP-binding protein